MSLKERVYAEVLLILPSTQRCLMCGGCFCILSDKERGLDGKVAHMVWLVGAGGERAEGRVTLGSCREHPFHDL